MRTIAATLMALGVTAMANADYRDWCEWDELIERIGVEAVPTGDGVICAQIEVESAGNYVADVDDPDFDDNFLWKRSGGSGTSSHATTIGKKFYGQSQSLAPDIWLVNCWEVNHWLQGGFLKVGQGSSNPPAYEGLGTIKVWNHSWIGSFGSVGNDHDALRRVDWVVENDPNSPTVCVGINNGDETQALLSYAWNVISVGRRDGAHAWSDVPEPYEGAGRMSPLITGTLFTTSEATPTVSATAAMLVEVARDMDEDLGQASETIKAVLLAAASHEPTGAGDPDWSNGAIDSGPDRGWTDRPLDDIYGAGHLDVNRAHQILTGGRTPAAIGSDSPPLATTHGWDLSSVSVGNDMTWQFVLPDGALELSIIATWNRHVTSNFSSWTIADIDLELLAYDNGVEVPLLGDDLAFGSGNVVSVSALDNVEHLFLRDLVPGTYLLRATRHDGASTAADVAVAWWSSDEVGGVFGDFDGDGLVTVNDLLQLIAAFGNCEDCVEDLNGDGVVDVNDLLALLGVWS
jgi:hypothetical protein